MDRDKILSEVVACLAHDKGINPVWEKWRGPIFRRDAVIERVSVGGDLYGVKFFCAQKGLEHRAVRLFQASQAHAGRRTETCAIPEVFPYFNNEGVAMMEWVDGQVAADLLLSLRGQKLRSEIIRRMGQWLHWFHGAEVVESGYVPDSIVAKLSERCAEILPPRQDDSFLYCLKILDGARPLVRSKRIRIGALHGDFTPYNLIYAGEKTYGIDFSGNQGYLQADMARMMVCLTLHRWCLPTNDHLRQFGASPKDVAAFFSGYTGYVPENDVLLWRYLMLADALRRWLSLLTARRPLPRGGWARAKREIERRRVRCLSLQLAATLNHEGKEATVSE